MAANPTVPQYGVGAPMDPAGTYGNDGSSGTYVGVPQDYKLVDNSMVMAQNNAGGLIPGGGYDPQRTVTKPIYDMGALSDLYGAPPAQITSTQQMLYNLGFLSGGSFHTGIYDPATHDALASAYAVANANGLTLNQMQQIEQQAQQKGGPGVTWGSAGSSSSSSGSGSGPSYAPTTTTSTSTSENTQLTGRGTARGILMTALANELGREPTPREVDRFLQSLNAAERKHPSKSTTTATTTTDPSKSGDTNVTSDSNTTSKPSSVDATQKAEHFAKTVAPQEASRFQTANYMDVIHQMLGLG